jgi:hypothetical protein
VRPCCNNKNSSCDRLTRICERALFDAQRETAAFERLYHHLMSDPCTKPAFLALAVTLNVLSSLELKYDIFALGIRTGFEDSEHSRCPSVVLRDMTPHCTRLKCGSISSGAG